MVPTLEHEPGDRVPATAHYKELIPVPLAAPGQVKVCCSLIRRAGLPGATNLIPVLKAPGLDMCPGRLATTDAQ